MIFQYLRVFFPFLSRVGVGNLDLAPEEEHRRRDILGRWEKGMRKFGQLIMSERGMHHSISVREIPPSFAGKITKLTQDTRFRNAFSSRIFDFKMVEIDKLIALQGAVHLDYVEVLESQFPTELDESFVFDSCMRLDQEVSPVSQLQQAPNEYIFSSDSQDLKLVDVLSRDVKSMPEIASLSAGSPSMALILLVGQSSPLVVGYRIPNGIVLGNGFHRLFALRKNGIKYVPMLVVNDTTPNDLRAVSRRANPDSLLGDARPLLFKDYFDEELVFDVKLKPKRRSVLVRVEHEMWDIPM